MHSYHLTLQALAKEKQIISEAFRNVISDANRGAIVNVMGEKTRFFDRLKRLKNSQETHLAHLIEDVTFAVIEGRLKLADTVPEMTAATITSIFDVAKADPRLEEADLKKAFEKLIEFINPQGLQVLRTMTLRRNQQF